MTTTSPAAAWLAAAVMATAGLGACNPREAAAEKAEAAAPSDETVAQGLDGQRDLSTLKSVVANGDLAAVFGNPGSYTILAPTNAAFETAGGDDLSDAAMGAQAAALVRAHVLPGALSRRDIEAAVARAQDGRIRMTTMDEVLLTFSKDGDALVVATPDGVTARLTGEERLMKNGAIQPIDALLVRPQAQAAS